MKFTILVSFFHFLFFTSRKRKAKFRAYNCRLQYNNNIIMCNAIIYRAGETDETRAAGTRRWRAAAARCVKRGVAYYSVADYK